MHVHRVEEGVGHDDQVSGPYKETAGFTLTPLEVSFDSRRPSSPRAGNQGIYNYWVQEGSGRRVATYDKITMENV